MQAHEDARGTKRDLFAEQRRSPLSRGKDKASLSTSVPPNLLGITQSKLVDATLSILRVLSLVCRSLILKTGMVVDLDVFSGLLTVGFCLLASRLWFSSSLVTQGSTSNSLALTSRLLGLLRVLNVPCLYSYAPPAG